MNREPFLKPVIAVAVLAFGALGAWFLAIPLEKDQVGFRGLEMGSHQNANVLEEKRAANVMPEPQPALEADELSGPRASEVYENVQVLGHLSEAQFNRIMAAITEWVSPEQGCVYCHNEDGNFASDDNYAKLVSRRMFQMTQHINGNWTNHVGDGGVTCYTCHRGKNVPEYIWFNGEPDGKRPMLGARNNQNEGGLAVSGYSSLPHASLVNYLVEKGDENNKRIRVQDQTALDNGFGASIQDTEWTYGLMMHLSESLGVNCTVCHNSREFGTWSGSTPQRVTAWHGIRMVRDLNSDYLLPLKDTYPDNRLGPTGDAPKANCSTCHQGVQKPLYGANMLQDYLASLTPPEGNAGGEASDAPANEAAPEPNENAAPPADNGEAPAPPSDGGAQ